VLVNASDVFAMGGRPLAVVDALFSGGPDVANQILEGIRRAASQLGIPVVGGHTNLRSPHTALAVSIVGRATSLITSFDARPGDDVVVAIDLRGKMLSEHLFWDATDAPSSRMREDYEVLPKLAEAGLVRAGKDISMGGLAGSLLMLLESSGVGADLLLDRIPCPADADLARWLCAFPSYGFVLAVKPERTEHVLAAFAAREIASAVVGCVDASRKLTISSRNEREVIWDLAREGLTQSEGARSRHA
jgi:selenophosphate synthetase-related protein